MPHALTLWAVLSAAVIQDSWAVEPNVLVRMTGIRGVCLITFILSLDIDECTMMLDNCNDQTTVCFNTLGSFDCVCRDGYVNPNGSSCQRNY